MMETNRKILFCFHTTLFVVLASLLTVVVPLHAEKQVGLSSTSNSSQIGILLLPALDATRDSANMQAPRQAVIRHRQQAEFITRRFKMLGENLALKAAAVSPAVDLATLSGRTLENMDLLAQRTGADWVVHTVIEDVDANCDSEGRFLINTRLLVQIWDVRRHCWLLNHRYTGQATGVGSPVMIFLHSLDTAAKESIANLLTSYPAVVTVEADDSLVDYLAGQTEPVIGEAGKPFRAIPSK